MEFALAGKFGFVFKFAVALMIGFDGVRAIRTVNFGRQWGGECRGGEKSQNAWWPVTILLWSSVFLSEKGFENEIILSACLRGGKRINLILRAAT